MILKELLEPNAKKAVFTFGRFNPPTKGHARLMDVVKNASSGADHYVFTGKTNDPKKNPLQYKDKITFLRAMFPHMNIMDDPSIRTPWEALEELGKQYDEVVMVVGSDRKQDFESQMRPYLKDFGIEKFSIVSSGERDADATDVSGVSASKARALAKAGDFKTFSQTIDGGEKLKQQLYTKVRQGMGIQEQVQEDYATMTKELIIKLIKKGKTDDEIQSRTGEAGKRIEIIRKSLEKSNKTSEMANKPKMPKKPDIKSRDPNWKDMEAIRKSGAAGSHKDKKALDKRGYEKHKSKSFDMDEAPQGKPIAYVDMDGVLANFFAEYAKLAGVTTGNYKDIPPAKTDPTLDKMVGTDFFDRLPKFPTTDKLIQMVVKEFGSYKILSSPLRGDHENSKVQKIKWIKRELAIQPEEIIVVGRKDSYAVQADGTQNILIDDRGKNIQGWLQRGGYGVKYQADEDPLSKVQNSIKDFKEKNNLTEHGGRVVKGINTTHDVGVDAIKKQSAKFGFKVTKDGVPPILAPKNLRRVKRMQEALIRINGSNKNLTLQQQIDLQEIKKGIGKMIKATREVASEVPYQNDGGEMSLLTHPGTKMHQKMRATAKPGTEDWFKTWRTLSYLTKGRKNHYMLPVKEQLERLLIKHGILDESSGLQGRTPNSVYTDKDDTEYGFVQWDAYPQDERQKFDSAEELVQVADQIKKELAVKKVDVRWANEPTDRSRSFAFGKFKSMDGNKELWVGGYFNGQKDSTSSTIKDATMIDLGLRRGSTNRTSTTHKKTSLNVQPGAFRINTSRPSAVETIKAAVSKHESGEMLVGAINNAISKETITFVDGATMQSPIQDDFMEVVAPIAVIHGHPVLQGPIDIAISDIFKGEDLKDATVTFPIDQNSPLVDCYINKGGMQMAISHKGKKGAKASVSNIYKAKNDAANTQTGQTYLKKFKNAVEVLDIIASQSSAEGPITLARKFNIITQQEADTLLPMVKDPRVRKDPKTRLTGLNGAPTAAGNATAQDLAKGPEVLHKIFNQSGYRPGSFFQLIVLAVVAKKVAEYINNSSDINFGEAIRSFLNSSAMIQASSYVSVKNKDAVATKINVVYPPQFKEKATIESNAYYGTHIKSKFSFSMPNA